MRSNKDGSHLELDLLHGHVDSSWQGPTAAVVVLGAVAIAALSWTEYSFLTIPLTFLATLGSVVLLEKRRWTADDTAQSASSDMGERILP